ncbi:hypothetical protein NP493_33g07000 [Ridgeia piscesae]|uniref:lysozyme n=1 Tax=Ridgeia piscesae TaxID=27915 RepID=A0AAD9PCW6_RIDPI|nr:hypothetical protein NP493_33g07000 [Ridgeia piscesae]
MSIVPIATLLCLAALSFSVSAGLSPKCLLCMCKAYGCKNWKKGTALGYYHITWKYWADCGKPGRSAIE